MMRTEGALYIYGPVQIGFTRQLTVGDPGDIETRFTI